MIYLRNRTPQVAPPGWHRTVVESRPAWSAATLPDGTRIVVGNPVGACGHHVDVWYPDDIAPGQRVAIDLDAVQSAHVTPPVIPVLPAAATRDPIGYFGLPTFGGVPVVFDGITVNGAGIDARLHARIGPFVAVMHVTVYPGDIAYPATVRVMHSGAPTPQAFATLPVDVASIPAGTRFAYGMSLVVAGVYRRSGGFVPEDRQVAALGRQTIGWLGNAMPGQFRGLGAVADIEASLHRTEHTWEQAYGGIPPNAGQSGAIGEQGFHAGFEAVLTSDPEGVAYNALHAALHAKRPCHYAHANGRPLDLERAGFAMWNGQPWTLVGAGRTWPVPHVHHYDTPGNWYGPDLEHLIINRLAADIEYRGDAAMQEEATFLAHQWLASQTVRPDWALTHQYVARALGWNSLAAVHLWRVLNDRDLAARVRERAVERARLHQVRWGDRLWDVRGTPANDLELDARESPFWTYTYQMAVGAFGAYVMAEQFGAGDVRAWAGQAAELCVAYAWDANGVTWERIGLRDPLVPHEPATYVNRRTAWTTGGFAQAWLPLALWTACRHNPANERARVLYDRTLAAREAANLPAEVIRWLPRLEAR